MGRPKTDIGEWGKVTVKREGEHRDGTPRWVARARVRNLRGRLQPVMRTGTTSADARQRVKDAMREEARRVHEGDLTPDTPFRVLAQAYIDQMRRGTLAATTCDRYEQSLRVVVLPEIGEVPLRRLTSRRLQVLFNTLTDNGRHPGGMSAIRSPLSNALKLAVQDDVIPSNPMAGVEMPRKEMAYSTSALEPIEIEELLTRCRAHKGLGPLELHDIVLLLVSTGARISEVLGLTWANVAMPDAKGDHVILYRHNAVKVAKKGMVLQSGKTKAARRDVLMSPMVIDMMRRRAGVDGIEESQPVFPVRSRNGRIGLRDPDSVRRVLHPIYVKMPKLAEVKQPTHIFRKTAATLMLEQGLSPREVADQLGHASVSMVLDVYGQRRQRSERAMQALDFTRGVMSAIEAR